MTGTSSGLGRALARHLAAAGHDIWGIARSEQKLAQENRDVGSAAFHYSVCDTTRRDQIASVRERMRDEGFIPEALVLNAGIYPPGRQGSLGLDHAESIFQTNLLGALAWVDLFLPDLIERGRGQFVAISSLYALRPDPHNAAYSASKAALSMAFRSLRLRYAYTGIEFKIVYLGPVDTPIAGGGPRRRPWIATADDAALFLARVLQRREDDYYYPLSGWLARLTAFLPDRTFDRLAARFRR